VLDHVDPSQDPVQIDVAGRPLVLDGTPVDDTGWFVSPTARISRPERGSAVLGALIGLFLVVAIAKPWTAPAGEPRSIPARATVAGLGPTPSATPDLTDLRGHCQEPLGWRVYSREGWNDQTLRVWRSVEPATHADGPFDATIPVVQLGSRIEALGYCSPWTGQERPAADAMVRAWILFPDRRGGDPYGTVTLRSSAPETPTVLGALYGPLVTVARPAAPGTLAGPAAGQGWPAGRYVFAISSSGWERWWAVDIAMPRPEGPPAPMPISRPSVEPSVVAAP
jgi:hypothetical protein